MTVQAVGDAAKKLFGLAHDQCLAQRLAGAELGVQGLAAHTQLRGDGTHPEPMPALGDRDFLRRVEEGVPQLPARLRPDLDRCGHRFSLAHAQPSIDTNVPSVIPEDTKVVIDSLLDSKTLYVK